MLVTCSLHPYFSLFFVTFFQIKQNLRGSLYRCILRRSFFFCVSIVYDTFLHEIDIVLVRNTCNKSRAWHGQLDFPQYFGLTTFRFDSFRPHKAKYYPVLGRANGKISLNNFILYKPLSSSYYMNRRTNGNLNPHGVIMTCF